MVALFGITPRYIWFVVPIGGYLLGKFIDDQETLRMTSYRDKSSLYGNKTKKDKDKDAPPSWP